MYRIDDLNAIELTLGTDTIIHILEFIMLLKLHPVVTFVKIKKAVKPNQKSHSNTFIKPTDTIKIVQNLQV